MKVFFFSIFILFIMLSCENKKDGSQSTVTKKASPGKTGDKDTTAHVVQRFGMVTGLKADRIDYYKKLHAAAWPGVLKEIKQCNIQNYSIYLQKLEGKYFLFSYFEYVGENFEDDMKKMAEDSTTQRWWKETGPAQNPLPEAAAKNETWTRMEEVFHTN